MLVCKCAEDDSQSTTRQKLKWISYRAFYDSYQLTELDLSYTSISGLL